MSRPFRISTRLRTILLLACFSLTGLPPVSAVDYVKGSAEDLLWQPPATVHDFKKRSDLHNRLGAIFVLFELEFTRLGDLLISAFASRQVRPLEKSVDSIGNAYGRLPQVRPVRRVGELVDAVQIPEFSLSDARGLILFSGGSNSGAVSPIMQVRLYKILVFVEDIINDVDDLVMLPVNVTATRVRGEKTDLRSVGYAGNVVGLLRNGLFTGIRAINRGIIRLASNTVRKIEGGHDALVRRRKNKKHGGHLIYARLPAGIYETAEAGIKKEAPFYMAGTQDDWKHVLDGGITVEEFLDERPDKVDLLPAVPDAPVLFVTEIRYWRRLPGELRPYVITGEEFERFLAASPA